MIIDSHVHIWPTTGPRLAPAAGQLLPEAQGDLSLLLAGMDAHGVDLAVLVQTPWHHHNYSYLRRAMMMHPGRFLLVGYLPDPTADDAVGRLRQIMNQTDLVGLRLHLNDPAMTGRILSGAADPALRWAVELGLTISLLYDDQTLHEEVGHLAERHPRAAFVIDHLGGFRPGRDASRVLALAAVSNIYIRLSNHVKQSAVGYPWPDLAQFQTSLIKIFGADRVLWGSNFPLPVEPATTYAQRLEVVSSLPFLNDSERDAALAGTARRLYFPALRGLG